MGLSPIWPPNEDFINCVPQRNSDDLSNADIFPNKQGKLRWAAPLVRQETPPSQSWQEQTLINTDLSQGNIRKPGTVGKGLANCMSGLSGDPSNTTLVLQFFPLPVSTLLAN